jgi:hypothetical protein
MPLKNDNATDGLSPTPTPDEERDGPEDCAFCQSPSDVVCHSCWRRVCYGHVGSDDDRCVGCIRARR